MSRFVILSHDWPVAHYDFMLEQGDSLNTWRLPQLPAVGQSMVIARLDDHRTDYLDYEGPVSGGRGQVWRWDSGTYELIKTEDKTLAIQLNGERIHGRVIIENPTDSSGKLTVSD